MEDIDERTHSRHGIHCDQVFEGIPSGGGGGVGGAQTHKVDHYSERKLCGEGSHPLSLTVHHQKIVEHRQRNEQVQEEIDLSQSW